MQENHIYASFIYMEMYLINLIVIIHQNDSALLARTGINTYIGVDLYSKIYLQGTLR